MPSGVKAELKKGLKWHEEGYSGDGLKPETVSWATRMANGQDITPEKAIKMRAWLARHESDKKGEGFKPGEDGFPSPGRVAWALWGGDPAVTWSNKIVTQMKLADEEEKGFDDDFENGKKAITRVWNDFIKKQHEPTQRKLLKAVNKYLDGARQRYAQRLDEQILRSMNINSKSFLLDYASFLAESIEKLYIIDIIGAIWEEEFRKSGVRELKMIFKLAKKDPLQSISSWSNYGDLLGGISKKYIDTLADEMQKTTSKAMQKIVSAGLNEGLPIKEIASQIRLSTTFNRKRSMLIARTESTRLHGQAAQTSIEDANNFGLKVKKSWIGNLDQYTRNTHQAMIRYYAKNPIEQNDYFISPSGAATLTVGGFNVASEDCNCRCAIKPVVVE